MTQPAIPKAILAALILATLPACSTPPKRATLADVDIVSRGGAKQDNVRSVDASNDRIRTAYSEYLKHAAQSDKSRITAISRLAELEFQLGNAVSKEKSALEGDDDELIDAAYEARLNGTIELIETSLREYPNASGNDKLLYNLANAHDQLGDQEKSLAVLTRIINEHPRSRYALESQFRVAEDLFLKEEYIAAEDGYTNVITSANNQRFIEKSFLKRGWSRFKLEYHREAIDDFLNAIDYHGFAESASLTGTEREIFDEYFRAIALSFIYMNDLDEITRYFEPQGDFKFIYDVYGAISNLYLKQNHFGDSAKTLLHFTQNHPSSPHVPEARITLIEGWMNNGSKEKAMEAIDAFYADYQPQGPYWQGRDGDGELRKRVEEVLRGHVLTMASHYHSLYQKGRASGDFNSADKWYKRYLTHYAQYSRKDNVHYLYAELLSDHKRYKEALEHYEMAAYDGDIILNKKGAYNTILITSQLFAEAKDDQMKAAYLNKHLNYARAYVQLYPKDELSPQVIAHAAELAYKEKRYGDAIELTGLAADNGSVEQREKIQIVRGHAYFESGQLSSAEAVYKTILNMAGVSYKSRQQIGNQLALAIYQQGEAEKRSGNTAQAVFHLARVAEAAPKSAIAADALNEAVELAIAKELWDPAIDQIKAFQRLFPGHPLNQEMNIRLSMVYLKSGQEISAAREYEKLARSGGDAEVRMAAQWKAAELYESNKNIPQAIKAYQEFSAAYPRPYAQNLEAMQRLVSLHTTANELERAQQWQREILDADAKAAAEEKSDRTRHIASSAALSLADKEFDLYKEVRLTMPLNENLEKKRRHMQSALKLYGQSSSHGVAATSTKAQHRIGEIYQRFSRALLDSERPSDLNDEELEQYVIQLEDQAFPFEDKAIEFFEANMAHIGEGTYDEWIRLSHASLKELFPARYNREARDDAYVNVLH